MTEKTSSSVRLKSRILCLMLFGIGSRIEGFTQGEGLKARAVRGSIWTLAGYGTSMSLKLVSNIVLAGLLFPEAFGTIALVVVFNSGLQMFSDVGIGPALIQHAGGGDRLFRRTAWTVQIARGLVLFLIGLLASVPFAAVFDIPGLAPKLAVASSSAMILGFLSTRWYLAQRKIDLKRTTTIALISQVIVAATTIGLAMR